MKIKNEYVQIKIGNKTWTKHNMILNEYLYKLFNSQINEEHDNCLITNCFIKLDTPIQNVDYDSQILPSSFDFGIWNDISSSQKFKKIAITSSNYLKFQYYFGYENNIYTGSYQSATLSQFVNRKIMGIGFGYGNENPIFAYLDTSNMNMVINANEKIMISRVDSLQTKGICKGIEYPLHLVNDLANYEIEYKEIDIGGRTINVKETTMAKLYSVGFGNTQGLMEEEYLINDVQTDIDDNSITLNVQRDKQVGIYPSNSLNTGFVPIKDNSKYLMFKYKLYRRYYNDAYEEYGITELDRYYTMNLENKDFGDLNIKLKIERL